MIRTLAFASGLLLAGALSPFAAAQSPQERVMAQIAEKTGLRVLDLPESQGAYLGKTHRGYEVVYTAKAGDVWGRHVARLMGNIPAGSAMDHLLSQQVGYPVSITVVLKHGKKNAPRLDVLSGYAKLVPVDRGPERARIGHNAGYLYAEDAAFAAKVAGNEALVKRLSKLRSQYIRLDADAATLFWAGSERDYSGMIMDHGDYFKMLNDIMDDLADIADAVPA